MAAGVQYRQPLRSNDVSGTVAYVGVGGNLALPARQVAVALHRLAAMPGVLALRASRLYRTRPWGQREQPDFINAVAELGYSGTATDLMRALLAIEREAGRVRGGERWGPRILDLDLLLFGDEAISTPELTVPHPRIAARAFVVKPLAELAPSRMIPGVGRVGSLAALVDPDEVSALDCPP